MREGDGRTTRPTVAIAGGTHLGIVTAAAAAAKGFPTVLYDEDPAVGRAVAVARAPMFEPGLDALLMEVGPRLRATDEPPGLAAADLVFVAADTPTDEEGRSRFEDIEALLATALSVARPDATCVMLSQVPPGFTRAHQPPDRPLYYQVETLAVGRAVERALTPERIIVGCPDAGRELPASYEEFLAAFGCPVLPMSLESAELAKIAVNALLAACLSMTNALAELCEVTGASWAEIAPALRLDKRIGRDAYLTPGLGFAGGHLERDLATILRLAREHGTDASPVESCLASQVHRRDWALRLLHRAVLSQIQNPRIALLGLAYKENTDSTRNSAAIDLLRWLGCATVKVFDPQVRAIALPHASHAHAEGPLQACAGADAVAVMTPWDEFRTIDPGDLAGAMRGRLVLDPYGVLDLRRATAVGLNVHVLGRRIDRTSHA